MPSLQSILSDYIAGLLVLATTSILTYIIRSIRRKPSAEQSGITVASVIEDYIERQIKYSNRYAQSQRPQSSEKRGVEHRRTRKKSDSEDPIGMALLVLVVVGILDGLWTTYKFPMFYATLAVIGIGLGTSVFYIVQLRKMNPPYQLEDYVLSWGSLAIWVTSAVTSWLAVYAPLYRESAEANIAFRVSAVHAGQLVGMVLLFTTIVLTALIQLVAGNIYKKALQRRPPNRFELNIWNRRTTLFIIILISIIVAFVLSTGVLGWIS